MKLLGPMDSRAFHLPVISLGSVTIAQEYIPPTWSSCTSVNCSLPLGSLTDSLTGWKGSSDDGRLTIALRNIVSPGRCTPRSAYMNA